MKKSELIERLKDNLYEEDLPWTFTAYKMQDILYWLQCDFYLETLGTFAWEWEETLYLSFYEPIVNAIILTDEMRREYKCETVEDIADYILEFENIYNTYKKKFLPLKKGKG